MPRRAAWALFLAAAVLAFLAVTKLAWAVTGLPDWLEPAALCALALGCVLWTIPGNPTPLTPREDPRTCPSKIRPYGSP